MPGGLLPSIIIVRNVRGWNYNDHSKWQQSDAIVFPLWIDFFLKRRTHDIIKRTLASDPRGRTVPSSTELDYNGGAQTAYKLKSTI